MDGGILSGYLWEESESFVYDRGIIGYWDVFYLVW